MKPKLMLLTAPLLLMILFIGGCNIFGWTSGESAESLIDEGKRHMRDADYAAAAESFAKAMQEDPRSSDARYYHAKATMHGSGFNAFNLADIISDMTFYPDSSLPFTGDEWPITRANKLYQAMTTVYDDLTPIIQKRTHGSFDSSDISLDYGLVGAFSGILGFQDTDVDKDIDGDDFRFSIKYNDDSTAYVINNLLEFFQFYTAKPGVGKVATPIVIHQDLVDMFNALIDNIDELIANAILIIESLFEDSELDLEEITETLREIVEIAQYYKINDDIDNDGDSGVDEEIINGHDDDGDGMTDEDSNGMIDFDYVP